MQKPDPLVVDLNTRMFANGIKPGKACERAGVNASTWSRWAAGGAVHLATFRKIEAAVDGMISDAAIAS